MRAMHQPLEEGMMADLSADRLLSEIDSLHRRDDYLTRRLAQNLEKLGVLRGEWAEAGLSPAAKLVRVKSQRVQQGAKKQAPPASGSGIAQPRDVLAPSGTGASIGTIACDTATSLFGWFLWFSHSLL